MTTVNKYLGIKQVKGDVGLELECEGKRSLPSPLKDWLIKAEGSLRGYACEYVSNGAFAVDDTLKKKITGLTDLISNPHYGVDPDSPRTSLHVHQNILGFTPKEYWTLATAYWLFENLLFKFCSEKRESNLFCLRLVDADGVIKVCQKDLKANYPFQHIGVDRIRYASQNLNATPKFGSIEYRGMRGTIDPEIIYRWVVELHNMALASLKFKDPSNLMDTFYNFNKEDFLRQFFSSAFVDILTKYPKWKDLLEDNVGPLCELAYYHTDWNKWQEKLEKNRLNNKINNKAKASIDSKPDNIYGLPVEQLLSDSQILLARGWGVPLMRVGSDWMIPGKYNDYSELSIYWDYQDEWNTFHGIPNTAPGTTNVLVGTNTANNILGTQWIVYDDHEPDSTS